MTIATFESFLPRSISTAFFAAGLVVVIEVVVEVVVVEVVVVTVGVTAGQVQLHGSVCF